jgi:adenylate cyclase
LRADPSGQKLTSLQTGEARMARAAGESRPEYRFGKVTIDVGRREIRVDGRSADIQPKVFDLLHYLLINRERVVDKDELMKVLWPDVVVTEASLTQALKKARKVVGDDGDRQTVIRTVLRRGFRFVACLDADDDSPQDGSQPLVASTQTLVSVSSPEPVAGMPVARAHSSRGHASASLFANEASVAVLPFVDMSAGKDQQYFCDGMAEEITNALSRIEGLRVAARTSAFTFRVSAEDVREIARKLDVTSIVEGSVRRAGEQLRVTAQLIDATSGFQKWSERWDRSLADVFAIQDEISTEVVRALKLHLTSDDRAAIYSTRARAVGAYDLYLRGLAFLHRFGRRSQRFALEMFHQAIEHDPSYAPAWAGVAASHVLLYSFADATEEHRRLAAEAGARAVELDPLSAEAHVAAANAATLRGDYAAADASFERAEMLNPRLFEAWYFHGCACASLGDHARAVDLYERAALAQPEDYQALVFAVQSYRSLGRQAMVKSAAERGVKVAERALALHPDDVRALSVCSAGALQELGRADDARRWTERAYALEPDEPFVNYNAAACYLLLGDHERAIHHLNLVGVETWANPKWLEQDSAFDALRTHPRFRELIARAG